ncbi:MAG TPA: LamG-like jellyroll fold domain-containing protein, partial [Bacillota bacterium]|nr:LamG-like jellyroll fold domain-containing protein [Bacillota bacterium]
DVPANATNLTVCVTGNTDTMELYVRRADLPTRTVFDYRQIITPPGGCLSITIFDDPPLTPGRYYIGVYNPSTTTQHIRLLATIYRNPFAVASTVSGFSTPVTIQDDAVTYAYITNKTHLPISDVDVSLLINHPRISDLAITLVSPNGTRVVLFEDRGATWTNGLGTFNTTTNSLGIPVFGTTNMVAFYTNDFEAAPVGPYAPGAVFQGWSVLTNFVNVEPDLAAPWLTNNVLVLGDGVVSNSLPTTNSTAYSLSFKVTHAPYLVGTVGWWPLDGDGSDIFGGFNGLLSGNVLFTNGMVYQAYVGDGLATRMVVPRAPALDVGQGRGFAIEGWINPVAPTALIGATVFSSSFEGTPNQIVGAPDYFAEGWRVDFGSIEIQTNGSMALPGLAHSGLAYIDANGWGQGIISTNITLVAGKQYQLSVAFTRNPDSLTAGVNPQASINLNGPALLSLAPANANSWNDLGWQTTSVVFTASAALSKLEIKGLNAGASGVCLDTLMIREYLPANTNSAKAAPLVEWFDVNKVTNTPLAAATFVPLQNPTATFSQTASGDFSVERAIDGNTDDNLGWAIQFGIGPQTAVFETVTNVGTAGGSVFTFTFIQNAFLTYHPDTLGRFRLSVTTDDRSTFADGLTRGGDVTANWTVLEPIAYTSANGATLTKLSDNSILAGGLAPDRDVYTVVAQTPLANITGVRLEVLTDPSLPFGGPGRESANGNFVLSEFQMQAAPLQAPETPAALGVQFWLGDLSHSDTNSGILSAAIWDTNSQPHYIGTLPAALTNGGWQHVALSFDAFTRTARLYTNGQLAVAQVVATTNFVPRTSGDLYFGFHPVNNTNFTAFAGGLDELGLYQRPLSDCEVAAIFQAGLGGKYGTNVLTCPVTNAVQLLTSVGTLNFAFTNGYAWSTNGPAWETNTLYFTNLLQCAVTNGPATNVTALLLSASDPNAQVDDFVLSALRTNFVNGLLNFTDNTNLALLPIKFAPAPYAMSNFPPTLIFSNDFESVIVTQGVYKVGDV